MAILIYVETEGGVPKKSSMEALTYGAEVAKQLGKKSVALVAENNDAQLASLGNYGAAEVLQVKGATDLQSDVVADLLVQAAKKIGAEVIVLSKSTLTDAVAPILGVKLEASVASNVIALPNFSAGFTVRKGVFTGKGFADVKLESAVKVLTIKKNAVAVNQTNASATVAVFEAVVAASGVKITHTEKQTGDILLPEADLVVSAGRGMKGAENWGMVEELAKTLGAATACSKPVSDMDWRPHHEHVGQTGIKVSPNLYIALGISGAIQHLAGVNSSKVIVVVNKDPEAPFFKSADYGIVGDVFDVIPKLTAAIKKVM
jgi:electron transfer flavoprotein alpha subunit